jgi:hypothetical protein
LLTAEIDAVPFGLRGVHPSSDLRSDRELAAGRSAEKSPRDDVQSGVLRQVLPGWIADDSTLTALMPYRQGLLPSVRAFVEHLAAELPKAVRI